MADSNYKNTKRVEQPITEQMDQLSQLCRQFSMTMGHVQ